MLIKMGKGDDGLPCNYKKQAPDLYHEQPPKEFYTPRKTSDLYRENYDKIFVHGRTAGKSDNSDKEKSNKKE